MLMTEMIGTTISSRDNNKIEKIKFLKSLGVNMTQLYIEPKTKKSDIKPVLDEFRNRIIVHAAGESHGFNLMDGLNKLNKGLIDNSFEMAEFLGAKNIVFHAGYKNYIFNEMSFQDKVDYDKKFDQIVDYLSQWKGNILIENMPKWHDGKEYIFSRPTDVFYFSMEQKGFGVCFDISSAAVSANCYPVHLFDHPKNNTSYYFEEDLLKVYHEKLIEDFLSLSPQVMHIRGTGYEDLLRYKRSSTGLNKNLLQSVLPYMNEKKIPLILEVDFKEFEKELNYLKLFFPY